MANHASHGALPCIKGARHTVLLDYLNSSGVPTDPTSPDTEFSLDNGAMTDCAEEVTLASGSRGRGMITLTGAETNGSLLALWSGGTGVVATPKEIPILNLPIWTQSTLTAAGGTASTLTGPSSLPAISKFFNGAILRTTGGTGGGGTGGANNQARRVRSYINTLVFNVSPDWEVTPDNTTTFEILVTPEMLGRYADLHLMKTLQLPVKTGAVVAGTLETGRFSTGIDTSGLQANLYVGRTITFISGNNAQVARVIQAVTVAAESVFTVKALPNAAVAGDEFFIS